MKECLRCHSVLPETVEYFRPQKKGRFRSECRTCAHQTQVEGYYIHHERKLEQAKQHRNNHRETLRLRRIGRYWANPEQFRQDRREYGKSVKGKLTGMRASHIRRTRMRKLPNQLSTTHWETALNFFNGCCAICGRPPGLWHTLAADHWIPLSSPDCPGTIPTNIVPLCHGVGGCNNSKHAKLPDEWLEQKFGKRKAKQYLKRIHVYFEWLSNH